MAWVVVALMAVGNAGGRIVAGVVSDKIGRTWTLLIMMSFQAVVIFSLLFIGETQALLLVVAATLIGSLGLDGAGTPHRLSQVGHLERAERLGRGGERLGHPRKAVSQ